MLRAVAEVLLASDADATGVVSRGGRCYWWLLAVLQAGGVDGTGGKRWCYQRLLAVLRVANCGATNDRAACTHATDDKRRCYQQLLGALQAATRGATNGW